MSGNHLKKLGVTPESAGWKLFENAYPFLGDQGTLCLDLEDLSSKESEMHMEDVFFSGLFFQRKPRGSMMKQHETKK